jgi:hypothetical protein
MKMYRSAIIILIGSLSVGTVAAHSNKNASAPAPPAMVVNGSLANGSAIGAALTKPIDSRKMKPGDLVIARTMEASKADGKTVIPSGAKLVGHVTQASARANGDPYSAVEFVFDKAVLKHGEEIPLDVEVRAVALPQTEVMGDNGELTAGSRGVYGLRGIGLGTVTAGNQPAAFITSTAKEVHLDSGTQLLLVAQTTPAQVSAN